MALTMEDEARQVGMMAGFTIGCMVCGIVAAGLLFWAWAPPKVVGYPEVGYSVKYQGVVYRLERAQSSAVGNPNNNQHAHTATDSTQQ